MIVLGVPVINQKTHTKELIDSLVETVSSPENFHLVLIDNGSTDEYKLSDYNTDFKISLIKNDKNLGYYYPLKQVYEEFSKEGDLVGLMHNDLYFYEKGWDKKINNEFEKVEKLGLVGLVGSYEVDRMGGRGGGTMCFFRGERGEGQSAGTRLSDLHPAVCLDSLFMLFNREAIPGLKIDSSISPCHFFDRIWSIRTVENGWKVAVLGVEIDHKGGTTSIAEEEYQRISSFEWCKEHGIEVVDGSADLAIYLHGERLFLSEYRDSKAMIPCRVDRNWNIIK